TSVVGVTLLYALIVFVATGVISYFDLGASRTPIADAAARFLGPFGARLIAAAGLLATLSSANASVMAAARISFAMSRDQLLWEWMQALHPRWRSPYKSTLATGAIAAAALWWGDGRALAEAAGFLHLYPFILLNLAVLALRRSPGYETAFRTPGGPLVPLAAALTMLWLLSQVNPSDALRAIALVLPGLAVWLARRGGR
ncbi:MAG TPA: amino acid permease, partial [Limnochordia bacterium]